MRRVLLALSVWALALAAVWAQSTGAAQELELRIDEHLRAAAAARKARQPRDVERHVNAAWELARPSLDLRRAFVSGALEGRLPRAARRAIQETLPMAPDDAFLHGSLGALEAEAGNFELALAPLERATAADPENQRWWAWLAWARVSLYRVDAAFAALDRAQELRPNDLFTLRMRARCEFRVLRLEECEKTSVSILEQAPGDSETSWLLARVRRKQGRYESALKAADQGLSKRETPRLRLERGLILLEAGRPREALTDLRQAASLDPRNPQPFLYLSMAYTRLGRKEESEKARTTFEKLSGALSVENGT